MSLSTNGIRPWDIHTFSRVSYPSRAKSCITLELYVLLQGYGPQPRYEYLLHCCIEFIKLSVTLEKMEKGAVIIISP